MVLQLGKVMKFSLTLPHGLAHAAVFVSARWGIGCCRQCKAFQEDSASCEAAMEPVNANKKLQPGHLILI